MAELKEFKSTIIEAQLESCFSDFCWKGTQFCSITARRCEYCNAHHHSCFTNLQEKNCTQYCMDQWIQNFEFQKAKEEGVNDLYRWLFFIVLGISLILIGLIAAYACNARFRSFVSSVIASYGAPCLSCGRYSTVSTGHVISNSPGLAAHPYPPLQHHISSQNIAQNNVPPQNITHNNVPPQNITHNNVPPQNITHNNVSNRNRQDGDGHSQFEGSFMTDRERRRQTSLAQLPAQSPSSNMNPRVHVSPMQRITKSKPKTSGTASVSHRGEDATPLMTPMSDNTADSVTYAKQRVNDGSHPSNDFRAMGYVLSDDTGYISDT